MTKANVTDTRAAVHAGFGVLYVLNAITLYVRVFEKQLMPVDAFAILRDAAKRKTTEPDVRRKSAEKKPRGNKSLVRKVGGVGWHLLRGLGLDCALPNEAFAGVDTGLRVRSMSRLWR